MGNKLNIEFEGFNEVLAKLKRLNGNVEQTTEKALKETHKLVTEQALSAIKPHYRTGKTEKSLVLTPKIEWNSEVATVKTGFNISDGGLPSIFLIRGTKVYGTPRVAKDQKLYNAFYGGSTVTQIRKLQEKIFWDEIRRIE